MRGVKHLGRVQAIAETTFGADPGVGYVDVDVLPGTVDVGVKRIMHDAPSMRTRNHGLAKLPSGSGVEPYMVEGDLAFTMRVHGRSTSIPSAVPSTTSPLIDFMVAAFGAKWVGGYDADGIEAACTASSLKCKDLSAFRAGELVAVLHGTTYSARFAGSIDEQATPDTLAPTSGVAFGGTPAEDSALWGSVCAVHADTFSADAKSYTIVVTMPSGVASPQARTRTFVGCRPRKVEFSGDLRGIATVKFTWAVAGEMDPANASFTTLDYPYPEANTLANIFSGIVQGGANTDLDFSKFSLTYDNDLKMDGDPNSPVGLDEWTKGEVKATLSVDPFWDDDYRDWHWDQTPLLAQIVLGHQPGSHVGIQMAAGRIADFDPSADRGGLMANAITLEMNDYSGDDHTDPAGDPVTGDTVNSLLTVAWT